MSDCTRWSFQRKIDWFRSQFAQHASLPFSEVLPAQAVTSALETLCMHCYNSLYNPVTVLWLFLSQVIHPNPTLAATVESFLAWRLGQGMSPCSTDTGGYARARQRLPEALLAMLVRYTGSAADRAALAPWRWLGRTVKLFDGSTVSMPDTPENQAAYPQSRTQAAGVGFPLARIGVLFSLSVGTVLNLGIRRWAGKLQSELAMLRDMIAESGQRATFCSPIAIFAPTWKSRCCGSKASISWDECTRNGTSIFAAAGSSAATIMWSDGASPRDPNGCLTNNTPRSPRPFRSASFVTGSSALATARERSWWPRRC